MPKIQINEVLCGKHCHTCGFWMERRALRKHAFCSNCKTKIYRNENCIQRVQRCIECDSVILDSFNFCEICGLETPRQLRRLKAQKLSSSYKMSTPSSFTSISDILDEDFNASAELLFKAEDSIPGSSCLKENESQIMQSISAEEGDLNSSMLDIGGDHVGDRVFIPRIRLQPSNSQLPFKFCRLQFPIRLAFAMTINKSQGQTFDKIGILLPNPVFAHGQLYVAFSRVRRYQDVKVQIMNTEKQGARDNLFYTKNVVYREIFE